MRAVAAGADGAWRASPRGGLEEGQGGARIVAEWNNIHEIHI